MPFGSSFCFSDNQLLGYHMSEVPKTRGIRKTVVHLFLKRSSPTVSRRPTCCPHGVQYRRNQERSGPPVMKSTYDIYISQKDGIIGRGLCSSPFWKDDDTAHGIGRQCPEDQCSKPAHNAERVLYKTVKQSPIVSTLFNLDLDI